MKRYLQLRGTVDMLDRAIAHVIFNPWFPDWYYPLIDKGGHHTAVQDALDILNESWRAVRAERDELTR
jgi:hypothetical protein